VGVTTMGYHKVTIPKGVYGFFSKIEEEFLELKDAVDQKAKILILCELSDLYGAMEGFASQYGMTMDDVKHMNDLTQQAFKDGSRR
jgi:phosphoribosyl-ATP pyrophosphohydrolase